MYSARNRNASSASSVNERIWFRRFEFKLLTGSVFETWGLCCLQAGRSEPKLLEGDLLVLINGRDISEHTHDQVVMFIRASRESHSRQLALLIRRRGRSVCLCVSFTEYSPVEVAPVVAAALCDCWIETYKLITSIQSVIVSKTVVHILFPLKTLSRFFFFTGAALCVQRINQQDCLCMIGLQHWNACRGSQSPQRIRNTHTVPGTCHDFWTWTCFTCIFLQLLMTPRRLSDSRFKEERVEDRLCNVYIFFQHLLKSKNNKSKTIAPHPAAGRMLTHAELIGLVGLLVLQGSFMRSEHQCYK